ncbi:hypothetical protein GUITHDRAFT_162379 [Guillardia theta CCMP2712]|uniref:Protein kinase domain-containing protein n=2 Tax=Guillardia theta TaxID=55529 RepID=L1JIZ6_GUITC|nr:hypothetical protein GUITHDRAFT_162379 [Guillardia theta CCMP2712]EKX48498.1 hypothetical protein GUITHDRAFT_162379 [Guillardia theta CCMP2712]|mmetsp:Transcript_50358/g.157286  ORF Transcript_50358/g.157286 Transcript_50358/m.157286 type:complete len:431 (+) Transcript_50358:191-1483(+)|eukprot:XP_005835478.1 hypothetical protein GUITHDRAFT_162379 [Guillardia theta CCMP2712]
MSRKLSLAGSASVFLVLMIPLVCGDAVSTSIHAATPPTHSKRMPAREVSHVDVTQAPPVAPVSSRRTRAGVPISREVSTVDVTQQNAEDLKLRTGHEANPQQSKSDDWLSELGELGDVLGVGSFSVVHAAKNLTSGQILAVKIVRIPHDNPIFVKRLKREVSILQEIDHPNIVKLVRVHETPDCCRMVTERCFGGELFSLLEGIEFEADGVRNWVSPEGKVIQFTESCIVDIVYQVLSAVKYLHDRKIVHRDLKLENVLLVDDYKEGSFPLVKVVDFGFAKVLKEGETLVSACGSPHYASPEVVGAKNTGVGYRFECDMWAMGVICYTLLCCQYPFDGDSDVDVINRVQKGDFEFPDHVKISPEAEDFVRGLVCVDITKRTTAKEALKHPWIVKNIEKTKMALSGMTGNPSSFGNLIGLRSGDACDASND